MNIQQIPASPHNVTPGRQGRSVSRILIHVQDGTQQGSIAWFRNPASNVSAHYLVSTSGDVVQMVQESDTAWHAGNWEANLTSIGIEHEGQPSKGPWAPTPAQLAASTALVTDICRRHGITPGPDTIIPHSRINPAHHCPGPSWPWPSYLGAITAALTPRPAHAPGTGKQVLRLFDPASNAQVGTASLIEGTDKAYIVRT